jgi:hypothetical protein
MGRVHAIFAILAATVPACAAMRLTAPDLTVVLDFKEPFNQTAVVSMEREASEILATTGLRLEWRNPATAVDASFADLVVFTFRGNCVVEPEPAPPLYDEPGPLAITRTANGEIQPFGEVDCGRVAASVRSAMWGGDFARKDELLGRALGRVLAHELVHMLTKSGEHSREGVQRPALSGKQLIADSLPLSALDIDRMKRQIEQR